MTGSSLLLEKISSGQENLLLVILDRWGIGKEDQTNPIYLANTPIWDNLVKKYPHTKLGAAGEAVGLKPGKMAIPKPVI